MCVLEARCNLGIGIVERWLAADPDMSCAKSEVITVHPVFGTVRSPFDLRLGSDPVQPCLVFGVVVRPLDAGVLLDEIPARTVT
jgi:hypothetical protein